MNVFPKPDIAPAPTATAESLTIDEMTVDVTGLGTRDKAIRIALALFAQRGYEASSMREIAEALGVSKAALYYHFDSKEAIVEAIIEGRMRLWDQIEAEVARREGDEILDVIAELIHHHGPEVMRLYMANGALKKHMSARKMGPEALEQTITKLMRGDTSKAALAVGRLAILTVWTASMTLEYIDLTDEQRSEIAVAAAKDMVAGYFAREH